MRLRDRAACLIGSHDYVAKPFAPCREVKWCRRCGRRHPLGSYPAHSWGEPFRADGCCTWLRCTACGAEEHRSPHPYAKTGERAVAGRPARWGDEVPERFRRPHRHGTLVRPLGPCDRVVTCGSCGYVTAVDYDYHHGTGSHCTVCGAKNPP